MVRLTVICTLLLRYITQLCFLILFCISAQNMVHSASEDDQYCPYFQNRAPAAQPNLENCTWYKDNACCLKEELDILFTALLPIKGASSECQRALNHLYCYVCSPQQSVFFKTDRLTVCRESCELLHKKCNESLYKGISWRDLYANGTDFCIARHFRTASAKDGECFDFSGFFATSTANTLARTSTMLVLGILLHVSQAFWSVF